MKNISKIKKILLLLIVITVLLIIIGCTHIFFIPFKEATLSMNPTFNKNDLLLINKFNLGLDNIQRGDLVLFYIPQNHWISFGRVIGLPLEKIEFYNGKVFINDKLLTEPYVTGKTCGMVEKEECKNLSLNLKDQQYFIMKDNREIALDSRGFGAIQKEDIIGKPFFNLSKWEKIKNKNLPSLSTLLD